MNKFRNRKEMPKDLQELLNKEDELLKQRLKTFVNTPEKSYEEMIQEINLYTRLYHKRINRIINNFYKK